ncbi:MFS transporter [Algicola sagamiensis]|uniref:hypothetical protein n=1 Tax=Algicola sagamiensis TaxID=163869 RepID=UPI00039C7116|nr:hypothetical protein [Algicola sagamiensis]
MALNPVEAFWGWLMIIWIFSLGESILFPAMNVQIDEIAPRHLLGTYFGASSFNSLGWASAPVVGGFFIEYLTGHILFLMWAGLCLVSMGMYMLAQSCISGITTHQINYAIHGFITKSHPNEG